jgi:hypothetical protein
MYKLVRFFPPAIASSPASQARRPGVRAGRSQLECWNIDLKKAHALIELYRNSCQLNLKNVIYAMMGALVLQQMLYLTDDKDNPVELKKPKKNAWNSLQTPCRFSTFLKKPS